MKMGIYANAFKSLPLEDILKKIHDLGADMIELGCGEESGITYIDPEELLADEQKLESFKNLLEKYNLQISAFSCHGNPVSPNAETARIADERTRNAVLLAEKLGVDTIITFSGCPGDSEDALYSNWVTTCWPLDYAEVLKWQWDVKLVPYWKDFAAFAVKHGVNKIALEMHPGQCCYNPSTIKRLRSLAGDAIGVNLDLSHLIWQRMDPVLVIRELKGIIYHMHAKDVWIDEDEVRKNGLITTESYGNPTARPWNFRTVGYGHGMDFWKNVFAELRRNGYDNVASIEAECELFSTAYSAEKAVEFLKQCMFFDDMNIHDKWIDRVNKSDAELMAAQKHI